MNTGTQQLNRIDTRDQWVVRANIENYNFQNDKHSKNVSMNIWHQNPDGADMPDGHKIKNQDKQPIWTQCFM